MGLLVSRDKTFVIASSWTLAKEFRPKLSRLGLAVKNKAKMLGIDFSCGKGGARATQGGKVKGVVGRRSRYQKVGKKAAGRLVKAGAAPAMTYGTSVYGMPNATLKAVRGFACCVKGEMRGRSTFARLQLARYDPGALCATGPIVDWARAIWDRAVGIEDLKVVWRRAHSLIAAKASPFRHVAGPGGAMLASCMRLGWKWPRDDHILKADGCLLHLGFVCPMQVKLHALHDLHRHEAGNSSLATRLGGPPDLEPLGDFLHSSKMRMSPASSSLRALGEGGWWTQDRLFQEGRVDDPWCRACGSRGGLGPARGTLHHRLCACVATRELRDAFKDQDIIWRAQSDLHGSNPLFQHGVPTLAGPPPTPRHEVRCCGAGNHDWTFLSPGPRSLMEPFVVGLQSQKEGRLGLGCGQRRRRGCLRLIRPCADRFPTALRAELRAVCELLVLAVPPITIWIDNREVLDRWAKGRQ